MVEYAIGISAGDVRAAPWLASALAEATVIAPFATPDNQQVEAMLADLIKGPFAGQKFKFHHTDPTTGKREVKEIGG